MVAIGPSDFGMDETSHEWEGSQIILTILSELICKVN